MTKVSELRQQALARIGQKMGAWQIKSLIGIGGAGAVYLATDGTRQGALKTLHDSIQQNAKQRSRFTREAQVTSQLNHPNVVQVIDFGTTQNDELFMVMEYLEGRALHDMMSKFGNRFELKQAVFVIKGLLSALSLAHSHGVIHRDIKPQNVFITTNPTEVKLLDFGVAHDDMSSDELTMHGAILGTPAFMSPEQARGRLDMLDARSDLFSCGALFYTMLTGKPIHKAKSAEESLLMAATKPFTTIATTLPDLHPAMVAVVDQALNWNPSKRFQSADAMLNATINAWKVCLATSSDAPTSTSQQAIKQAAAVAQHIEHTPEESLDTLEDSSSTEAPSHTEHLGELKQAFQSLERTLDTRRKYGQHHREVVEQMDRCFESFVSAISTHQKSVRFLIKPYSFGIHQTSVWEPEAPFDEVPYNVFSSGIRAIEIDVAISREEFVDWLVILTMDPQRDLPPEDDLGMVLWERNFQHIKLHMVTNFRVGDLEQQREFTQACEDTTHHTMLRLEDVQATHMQRAQLMLAIGPQGMTELQSKLYRPEYPQANATLNPQPLISKQDLGKLSGVLSMPRGSLTQRAPYTLMQVYEDQRIPPSEQQRFRQALSVAFTRYSRQKSAAHLIDFYSQLVLSSQQKEQRRSLTQHLFTPDIIERLFAQFQKHSELVFEHTNQFKTLLTYLDHRALKQVCTLYPEVQNHKNTVSLLYHYITIHAHTSPDDVGELLLHVHIPHARLLLKHLQTLQGEEALRAITRIVEHAEVSPDLLLETYTWLAQRHPAHAANLLTRLLSFEAPETRIRTLQQVKTHPINTLTTVLEQHTHPQLFSAKPYSERRLIMELLQEHAPYVARDKSIILLNNHSMGKVHNTSRQLAIEMLSTLPPCPEVYEALEDAMKRRPWNSKAVQEFAEQTLQKLRTS